jgi:AcrR family transcriptional regulator
MPEPISRPAGRPRSDASRAALLDAAYWQTIDRGYGATSAETIAKAAGAGKQTLYRWWPSKGALVLEAMLTKMRERIDRPRETAARAGDLEKYIIADLAQLRGFADALGGLLGEGRSDEALMRLVRDQWLAQRSADLYAVLSVGVMDGRRRDILVEAIESMILMRIVFARPLDDEFGRTLSQLLRI